MTYVCVSSKTTSTALAPSTQGFTHPSASSLPKSALEGNSNAQGGRMRVHLTPLGSTLAQRRCPRTQLDVVMTVLAGKAVIGLLLLCHFSVMLRVCDFPVCLESVSALSAVT